MSNENIRVNRVLKEFNIGLGTLIDFLKTKKIEIEASPVAKISHDVYALIQKEFGKEQLIKEQSKKVAIKVREITESAETGKENEEEIPVQEVIIKTTIVEPPKPKIIGKIDLDKKPKEKEAKAVQETVVPEKTTVEEKVQEVKEVKEVQKDKEVKEVKENHNADEKTIVTETPHIENPKIIGKIDLQAINKPKKAETAKATKAAKQATKKATDTQSVKKETEKETNTQPVVEIKQEVEREEQPKVEIEHIETKVEKLTGPKISGTIDLTQFEKKKSESAPKTPHKKRERIRKPADRQKVDLASAGKEKEQFRKKEHNKPNNKEKFKPIRNEVDDDAVQKQIKETYARMTEGRGKTKGSKHRKGKREQFSQKAQEEHEIQQLESTTLKVTEFVTVNDLAIMMDVPVTKVIEACMNLGLMVSINQRLDAEAMVLVAEEFGFTVEFVTADLQDAIQEDEDSPEDMIKRPPIVTVMGHVDHGKTSLLDYVRKANVIAGEAGGITQHIGAYNVVLPSGDKITFLDTPGHEAFTAMRARGAKVTDMAIIIIAADDAVMPQTKEAISHAQAAGVPMIFAINKIDKPGANSEKIKEQLANMNLLVEDWGGKYQSQEISAKKGLNVDALLDKILLESEMLDLKANPNKKAKGTIIESSLDKGRGYIATVLVQSGTLNVGDAMVSGSYTGKVKAMFNERGQKIREAGPSTPVSILGLNGAPAAGELFNVMNDEKEARELANKREQLIRIQELKTQKHITLEEIGRRIAIGNFQELNIILKADVDGSIEALADSLVKLSTEEVHVNVIHKAVGAISESDILLAAASNAIIIGFQVRPSASARKLAEKEEIEIRLYSVIYDAINEVKSGMEGMLAPEEKEEITATAEVRETFKISKVGTIAGCMVKEGKLTRTSKVRIIRDGIVIYTGTLGALKRFKDDVKEEASGYDCGLNIDGFNDIKIGDVVEAYAIVEIKRKL